MITETGRVVAIEANSLWVETIRKSTCNSCSAQKGCGHGLINKYSAGRAHHVRALLDGQSAADYHVDDEVEIAIPEQVLIRGAFLVYLLPLVTMLAVAVLADHWWHSDAAAVIGAVVGFIAGIAVTRLHGARNANEVSQQPVVVRQIGATRQPVSPV